MSADFDFRARPYPAGARSYLAAMIAEYQHLADDDRVEQTGLEALGGEIAGVLIERLRALLADAGVGSLLEQDHFLHDYVLGTLADEAAALDEQYPPEACCADCADDEGDDAPPESCFAPAPKVSPSELLRLPLAGACGHGPLN